MAKRKKKSVRRPSKGWHTITVDLSRDELFILQRVARVAGVNLRTLLRVVVTLGAVRELPQLVKRK